MTAIITGATGDIGKEFVQALYEEVDSIWAVGRNEGKLLELKQKIGEKVIPVRANLADESDLKSLCEKIETEKPQIRYLINNAGIAKMGEFRDFSLYAASKAYLLSFTRAINRELKDVTCTAVCPGWVDTQMLPKEKNG